LKTPTPGEIATLYGQYIYNIARRMLRCDADAEDVLQDVLKTVLLKLHTFKGDSDLKTWLYRVSFNAALAAREKIVKRQARFCSCDWSCPTSRTRATARSESNSD
jgi:RNA polymerase sigma factor (sigma-70 family)